MYSAFKVWAGLALSSMVVGCSSQGSGAAGSAAGSSAPNAQASVGAVLAGGDVPLDVEAANAAVPAALKEKISFEKGEAVDSVSDKFVFTAALPKGWVPALKGQAILKLESDALGAGTRFMLGTSCGGVCEAGKDWNVVMDDTYSSFVKGKVIKDERRKNGRTLVAQDGEKTAVVVATWRDGAQRYFHCGALLDAEAKELVEAVEKACVGFVVKRG